MRDSLENQISYERVLEIFFQLGNSWEPAR